MGGGWDYKLSYAFCGAIVLIYAFLLWCYVREPDDTDAEKDHDSYHDDHDPYHHAEEHN